MKGQLNLEFMISISIFIIVISYVTINSISTLPDLHQQTKSNSLRTKIYQMSELLLFDSRIGLSTGEPYTLDQAKINSLQSLCSDYQAFKDKFSVDHTMDIQLNIMQNGASVLDCHPEIVSGMRSEFSLKRFGILDGEIAQIDIKVFG